MRPAACGDQSQDQTDRCEAAADPDSGETMGGVETVEILWELFAPNSVLHQPRAVVQVQTSDPTQAAAV